MNCLVASRTHTVNKMSEKKLAGPNTLYVHVYLQECRSYNYRYKGVSQEHVDCMVSMKSILFFICFIVVLQEFLEKIEYLEDGSTITVCRVNVHCVYILVF